MKKTIMWALIGSALSMTNTSHALSVLEDAELSDVTGQALFSVVKETDASQGLDFFKLVLWTGF